MLGWGSRIVINGLAGLLLPLPLLTTLLPKQTVPSGCPAPALARITRHTVAPGDTLASIAQRYNLLPTTLIGFNPSLRTGTIAAGTSLRIPPYNGIQVNVPQGQTWREVATTYQVRADVMFEVNGCQLNPRVVFVPGVNWSPVPATAPTAHRPNSVFRRYPLPTVTPLMTNFGWRVDDSLGQVVFHGGVDLQADRGTPVLVVSAGTVAFAGPQGAYGNLIVVNHEGGLQTRYAQLETIAVQVGQTVQPGDRLGTVGNSGSTDRPHLHFEVRSNSDLGWVAQDPGNYFREMRLAP